MEIHGQNQIHQYFLKDETEKYSIPRKEYISPLTQENYNQNLKIWNENHSAMFQHILEVGKNDVLDSPDSYTYENVIKEMNEATNRRDFKEAQRYKGQAAALLNLKQN